MRQFFCVQKPCVLIPYPYAVDDHQTLNAKFLADKQAAILLPQTELNETKLADIINNLCATPHNLQAIAAKAKQCATPNALQQIIDLITK